MARPSRGSPLPLAGSPQGGPGQGEGVPGATAPQTPANDPPPKPVAAPEVSKPDAPDAPNVALTSNAITGLIHLYRAEVGRLTAYRARLDTTTSWGISSSAVVFTLGFGNADVAHAAFLFLMALDHFFVFLEARRFRYYEVSRFRVHILERFFFPSLLGKEVDPGWTVRLTGELQRPSSPVTLLAAMGWRLRKNYLGLFGAVLVAWIIKLDVQGGFTVDLRELVGRAALGSIPGWAVWAGVVAFYAWLIFLAWRAKLAYPMGDEDARELLGIVGD